MKKLTIFAAFSALALVCASCEKEQDKEGLGERAIWDDARFLTSFAMSAEEADTKATINFSSGAITWNDADAVLV